MANLNLPPSKLRHVRQWRLSNIIIASFVGAVVIFFLFVFGDSSSSSSSSSAAAVKRTTEARRSPVFDPRNRERIMSLMELGKQQEIDGCPADMVDHMPCEDPRINRLLSRDMNFYRERHCPPAKETPLCLIPPPQGYRVPVQWPQSLHKIWHENVPYDKIADRKGHQGWMKTEGPYFIFPGGGTMFPDGAVQYIQKLKKYIPIASGALRTALDMGCGVASFGGYMLDEKILTLSFAPRDSHKAQIQFALERGLPAFVAMLGTRRLPFPGFSFDLVHCSRCLIPFTAYNATYFLEVDRLLRPGGYLVISGPPVQWAKQEKEWADLQAVAKILCYELIVVDGNTVIWKKPIQHSCLPNKNDFGIDYCNDTDDPVFAWYVKLKKCVSRTSPNGEYAIGKIPKWPQRLEKAPARVKVIKNGISLLTTDNERWKWTIAFYKNSLKLKLGSPSIRNVMDMNAFFGGFATALISSPVWVMNVVPSDKPSTLGVIYDRGLIGVQHDWCEPFSTYPRTYDFIHVSEIESLVKDKSSGKFRCNLADLMVEIDRILRPEGTVIIRDLPEVINRVDNISRAIRWKTSIHTQETESRERVLVATKNLWKLPSSSY